MVKAINLNNKIKINTDEDDKPNDQPTITYVKVKIMNLFVECV